MIEVFKIVHNIYDVTVSSESPHLPFNTRANTKGNNYKLLNHTLHHDLRKHCFSARGVNIWNNLPNSVANASTVNAFRVRTVHEKMDRTLYQILRAQFRPTQDPIRFAMQYAVVRPHILV